MKYPGIKTILTAGILLAIIATISILSNKNNYYKELLCLEENIESEPEPVLSALQKLDANKFSDKENALYCLLFTKGHDLSGNTLQSDSLISISLDYYLFRNDSSRIFQSYFLRGRIFHKTLYLIEATGSYKKAKEYAASTGDLYTKYRLNRYMGSIYHFKMMWQEEKDLKFQALQYARELGDSIYIARSLKSIAEWYSSRSDYDSSIYNIKKALALCPAGKDSDRSSMYTALGRDYLKKQRPDSTLFFIDKAMKLDSSQARIFSNEYIKAYALFCQQENTSAEVLLKHSIDNLELTQRVTAYYDLFKMEFARNNTEKAFDYLQDHVRLRDLLDSNQKEDFLERLDNIEAYQEQQNKAKVAELELANGKLWFYRFFTLTMILILISLIKQYRLQKKKKLLERKIQIEKQKATEVLLEQQETKYQLLEEQEEREKLEIKQLELTVNYYKQLNAITVPILLKSQNKQGAMNLSDEEWDIIIRNTNACFDNFTLRLQKNYPMLDKEDIHFCCLVKMELSLSLLADIYHIAKGSISRKKMRLKEKMDISQISFDEFIKSFGTD